MRAAPALAHALCPSAPIVPPRTNARMRPLQENDDMTMTHRTTRSATFILALLGVVSSTAACASRTVETEAGGDVAMSRGMMTADAVLASWPMKQRETASILIAKYGNPDVTSDRMLVWYDTGPFKKTVLMREAVPHGFPSTFYARTAMEFKSGNRSSPYLTGLMFPMQSSAPDPDRPHSM
jgi:hypothetical protein